MSSALMVQMDQTLPRSPLSHDDSEAGPVPRAHPASCVVGSCSARVQLTHFPPGHVFPLPAEFGFYVHSVLRDSLTNHSG